MGNLKEVLYLRVLDESRNVLLLGVPLGLDVHLFADLRDVRRCEYLQNSLKIL